MRSQAPNPHFMREFYTIGAKRSKEKGVPPGSLMFVGFAAQILRKYLMEKDLAGDCKTRVRKRTQNHVREVSGTF